MCIRDRAKFVGMDNFVRVFTRDPVFWDSVVNTFIYVGGKLIPVSYTHLDVYKRQDLLYAAEALEGTAKREFYRITVRTKRGSAAFHMALVLPNQQKHAHQRREPVHCFYANHYVQRSDGSYLLSAVQYIPRRDQPFSDCLLYTSRCV